VKYRVEVARRVEKFLASLRDRKLQQRLVALIRDLETQPRPSGCRKLSGSDDIFRLRLGDYRIIYRVEDEKLVVLVIEIGHRRDIYR
jgi:mRNA interferase RelE/StbE